MDEKSKAIGSLPVPNVQSLSEEFHGSESIPLRYLRAEAELDPVVSDDDWEIPIVDFSRLIDPELSAQESARLHLACRDWGFFQLINHNIPYEVIEKVKVDVTKFFKLPLEEKKACRQLPGNLEGYGQLFVMSEDQKLDWADILYLNTQPVKQRNMSFWPSQPLTFRHTLDKYSSELYLLADVVLGFMAKNLGINPEVFANMFKDGIQSVRVNYYPPCPLAEKVLGFSPHSDGSLITLVLQANQVQGLQIKKNGGWVTVKPLSGAFVVNIGDSLEILSNGIYQSIEHRAIVNKEKERISIAAFHSPNSDFMIGPLPDISGVNEARYRTLNNKDFIKLFFSAKLEGKSLLDGMKLNR
ncbi:uncharacterized protein A4U43_C10F7870 [Asparagus officinalis]|uniref:Fe2OG dioxygenase domain-containing protein n=1 Tax=Asparagus officinalis TaxID=4686 RepID=A0A5P1E1A9_ASPOF|nr:S-norcoclaurine synthase 1-like [Asparagus officinalis]ONK56380.1 uncharacterized protein A4U43_C10F7870 [Asparagus officinalis]